MKIYIYDYLDGIAETVHRESVAAHRLDQHLEYLRRLEAHFRRYRTPDPDEADYFFVPILLVAFQFHERVPDPWPILARLPYLDRGRHILFASGDFGQRERSAHESHAPGRAYPRIYDWLDERFILLAFESTAGLGSQDIGIFPYVIEPRGWRKRLQRAGIKCRTLRRDLRFSFVGAFGYSQLPETHIRGRPLIRIAGRYEDAFVGDPAAAIQIYDRWRGSDIGMMRRSVFTLCPAGFGRWSFRFVQAPYYGSIAVLLADGYIRPLDRYIPWDRFCMTVAEADLDSLPDRLRAMPVTRIDEYCAAIRANRYLLSEESLHRMIVDELDRRLAEAVGVARS